MLLPERIDQISGLLAQFHDNPDPYPPIGFCPFADHELGNGVPLACTGRLDGKRTSRSYVRSDTMRAHWCRCSPPCAPSWTRPLTPGNALAYPISRSTPPRPSRCSTRLGPRMGLAKPRTRDCCSSRP